jgi:hypothetical protein
MNMNPERIVEVVLSAQRQPPACNPAVTAKDLTAEERRMIRRDHLHEPLPDGYFFNGSNFVDFDGKEYQEHPFMDKFIEVFLQKRNAGLHFMPFWNFMF